MEGNQLKIIFVIDESGSMQGSETDVIGGFNSYIEQQRKETIGKVTVSLYKFNSVVTSVIVNKPITKIKELNKTHYIPSGFTALYDAIGTAIKETDSQISAYNENQRPDKVLVVIITDGEENASKEFSSQAIKTLIATHENLLNWGFVYLGTGLKDFTDADLLGLKNRVNYETPSWKRAFNTVADSSIRFRKSNPKENDQIMFDLISDLNDEDKK